MVASSALAFLTLRAILALVQLRPNLDRSIETFSVGRFRDRMGDAHHIRHDRPVLPHLRSSCAVGARQSATGVEAARRRAHEATPKMSTVR